MVRRGRAGSGWRVFPCHDAVLLSLVRASRMCPALRLGREDEAGPWGMDEFTAVCLTPRSCSLARVRAAVSSARSSHSRLTVSCSRQFYTDGQYERERGGNQTTGVIENESFFRNSFNMQMVE